MTGRRAARVASPVAFLFVLLWPPAAFAQRGQDAGLVGTVRDGSDAVIEAATVIVSSPQLIGGPQKTTSDASGAYRFSFLAPGRYEVAIEQTGFKRATRSDIELLPGATLTLDFRLDIAAMNEAVLVQGPAPIVDVRTSAAPVLIDRRLVENLPLSRILGDTANLAPGVIRDVAFGGSVRSNPISMDGTSGNEPSWGTPRVTPNLNWIEELQVVSVGADAQYGEFTGARVNAITRSGSNTFSGLADFWTTRPSWVGNNRGSLTAQLRDRFRPLEIVQRWDSDVQLGGPLKNDRLWFFAGGEAYRNAYRPASFSGVAKSPGEPKYAAREAKFIGKLTAAVSPAARLEGYYAYDGQTITGTNAAPLVQPEALTNGKVPERIWNARLLWTVSPRAFFEFRHGGHNSHSYNGPPEERRAGPPGHYDTLTGVLSINATFYSEFLSRPIVTSAHLTYFRSGSSGRSHEIRTGFEQEHARLLQAQGPVGGRTFYDSGGRPDQVYIGGDAIYRPTYNRETFYVQDAWSAADRLTLNLGVRAGIYSGSVPDRGHVFSAHSVSPRIGAAWDLAGDHRTVLRAHYGRYHDAMVTTFFDFMDPLSQGTTIVAQAVGPDQFEEVTRFGSLVNGSIDPDVKFSYAEEYAAGLERQLPWGMFARAQFVSRDFKDTVGFIDTGSIWQPVERIDPGPDGRLDTADDGGPITVFYDVDPSKAVLVQTNPKGAYRRYRGVQAVAGRRFARDAGFQASYAWSRTVGSYNNAFSSNAGSNDLGTNGVFVNPNRAINAEGRTPQDFTHEIKMLGTYRVSRWGGLNISGVYRYQSGRITARTAPFGPLTQLVAILVEPRGSRQLPNVNNLDLRVEKTWKPSPKIDSLSVFADVFNVGNQGIALGITQTSGPNFLVPNNWSEPRSLRAGVRMMF